MTTKVLLDCLNARYDANKYSNALKILDGDKVTRFLKTRDRSKLSLELPLHVAVQYNVETKEAQIDRQKVVDRLIELYPEGAKQRVYQERLPIHFAAQLRWCKGGKEVMQSLIEAFPHGVREKDVYGYLPVHFATFPHSCDVEMVQFLCDLHPDGAKTQDNHGRLPVHLASDTADKTNEGVLATVKYLLEKYPGGAEVQNIDGDLPIHCSARRGNFEVTKLLVELYPNGLKHKNKMSALPIDLCQRESQLYKYLTEQAHPESVAKSMQYKGLVEENKRLVEENKNLQMENKTLEENLSRALKQDGENREKALFEQMGFEEEKKKLELEVQNYKKMATSTRELEKHLVSKASTLPMEDLKLVASQLKARLDLLQEQPSFAQRMFAVSMSSPELTSEILVDIVQQLNAEIASVESDRKGDHNGVQATTPAGASGEEPRNNQSNRPEKRARVSIG